MLIDADIGTFTLVPVELVETASPMPAETSESARVTSLIKYWEFIALFLITESIFELAV